MKSEENKTVFKFSHDIKNCKVLNTRKYSVLRVSILKQ